MKNISAAAAWNKDKILFRLMSVLVFLSGLSTLLHFLFIPLWRRFKIFDYLIPFEYSSWSRLSMVLLGFCLIYLSLQIFRRKKAAWLVTLILAAAHFLFRFFNHSYLIEDLINFSAVVILVLNWRKFRAKVEFQSLQKNLKISLLVFLVAIGYGTFGFWFLRAEDFGIDFNLFESFRRTIQEYFLIGNTDLVAFSREARVFLDSLRIVGLASYIFIFYSLFAPLKYRYFVVHEEREKALNILRGQSNSPAFGFQQVAEDKSYFFSASKKSFISYGVANGMAIALGDPVGDSAEAKEIIDNFVSYCNDCGWAAAFLQTRDKYLNLYSERGLRPVMMGQEATVDLEKFCNITIKKKYFRSTIRKFENLKISLQVSNPPHAEVLLAGAERISHAWLSLPGRKEHRFGVGHFDRNFLNKNNLFLLRDDSGKIIAFANEVPCYKTGEATIDLMRHDSVAPGSTMDFLFICLLKHFYAEGRKTFNFGGVPLSGIEEKSNKTPEEIALRGFYLYFNNFFSFKGLKYFKDKFEPEWHSQFLVYQDGLSGLAKLGMALRKLSKF